MPQIVDADVVGDASPFAEAGPGRRTGKVWDSVCSEITELSVGYASELGIA